MTSVYVEKGGELRYFIFGLCDDSDVCALPNINTIHESAFARQNSIKQILCESALTTIEKEAFKDCEKLEVFCCGEIGDKKETESKSKEADSGSANANQSDTEKKDCKINGIKIPSCSSEFSIQSKAFAGCKSLHTVILPRLPEKKEGENKNNESPHKLIIEKDAFIGCSSLRTFVALAQDIDFTENPFKDCPQELTFVCYEGSDVERFARENGYRYVNV